jgi:hypothetical protein
MTQAINTVTSAPFNADPTGRSDSTKAFAAALAGPSVAIVPPGKYLINNLVIPSGSSLIAYSSIGYGVTYGSSIDSVSTTLVASNSATVRVLNVDGAKNIKLVGFQIDCDYSLSNAQNPNCDGISAGADVIEVKDVTVRMGRYGIGGAVSTGTNSASNGICYLRNCQFFGCVTGVGELVDAWLTNCGLSYCTNGAIFTGLSGSVTLTGCRVEWNLNYGISIGNASDTIISATDFDRNYVAALYLEGTYKAAITGCHFKRNGRNLTSTSCHILFNAASNIIINGCSSRSGQDDDGAGPNSPAQWAVEGGAGSWNIAFVGCDLSGVTGTTPMGVTTFWTGTLPNPYLFSSNLGLTSVLNSGF